MNVNKLFDIRIPFRSKYDVKEGLFRVQNDKKILEILTTKKLLKASKDNEYAHFLNDYDYALIQGNITHFFAWQNMKVGALPSLYAKYLVKLPFILRAPVFFTLFFLKLLKNYTLLTITLLIKYRYSNHTKISPVVAKNLMFEIIKRAEEEGWSINNINTDLLADNVTNSFIKHMYPDLDFRIWDRKVTAIQQIYGKKPYLEHADFYTKYPMFWEVRKFLIQNPSDILLIATREGGREHEFLQELKNDEEVQFKFACVYDVDDINGRIEGKFFKKAGIFFSYIFRATLGQFFIALYDQSNEVAKRYKFINLDSGINDDKNILRDFLTLDNSGSEEVVIKYLNKNGYEVFEKSDGDSSSNQLENSYIINSSIIEFLKLKLATCKVENETWEVVKIG